MIRMARDSRRAAGPKALLVPNRVDPQHRDHPATDAAPRRADRALGAHGPRAAADHVEAFATGDWIGGHAPDSPATRDVLTLAEALEELLGTQRGTYFEAVPAMHTTV